MTMEEEPFIKSDNEKPLERWQRQHQKARPSSGFTWGIWVLAVAYVPLVLLLIYVALVREKSLCEEHDTFPSLAQSKALVFEDKRLSVSISGNPFAGPPRPELDAAWHDLFENVDIRVSREDLDHYDVDSLPLADGSGYAAQLSVHHELHCLKRIMHWIRKDYYLGNETDAVLAVHEKHVFHCIEMLREATMCRADRSLSTFERLAGDHSSVTAVGKGYHRCVDWQSLMGWVRDRSIPAFRPGTLADPEEADSM